jgi:hypothetical protein
MKNSSFLAKSICFIPEEENQVKILVAPQENTLVLAQYVWMQYGVFRVRIILYKYQLFNIK